MNDDAALLRRYAEEGSEAAFAELVHRHVDLVYGAALRRTGGDAHRAHDVAQQVFITLARDARKLSRHAVLAAWLHTATRNAALNLMISEQRRQTREAEAVALEAAANTGADPEWDRLRPLLDTAIDELPEADRAAVVLRFLEKRPFAEVGSLLQVSEDAARMRTDRALDKLREARALIEASGRDIRLEIDGGVNVKNIREIAAAGADTFVAGSAIFNTPDYAEVIAAMRAELALARG